MKSMYMSMTVSLVLGIAVFFGVGSLLWLLVGSDGIPTFLGAIFGILTYYFSYNKLSKGKSIKESIASAIFLLKSTTEDINSLVDDRNLEFYAIAEKEINEEKIDKGLWSKALVKSRGDENLRKAEYIKLRVKQLKK